MVGSVREEKSIYRVKIKGILYKKKECKDGVFLLR